MPMFGIFGKNNNKKDVVLEKFKDKTHQYGLKIESIDDEGIIYLSRDEINLTVSLENVRRDFARDQNDEAISNLVASIVEISFQMPNWQKSSESIHLSFVPNDYDFDNLIHQKVTEEFSKVFAHYGEKSITFISLDHILEWQVCEDDLEKAARENSRLVLDRTNIRYDIIDGKKLGMIESEIESLKPALLFAPNIKEKVSVDIGFPFFAVLPVRDFCYIFSQEDFEFFSQRLGPIVVDEYKKSGYPITTEILKFTESGIEAIGKYPV
jgi:hypothetical protein